MHNQLCHEYSSTIDHYHGIAHSANHTIGQSWNINSKLHHAKYQTTNCGINEISRILSRPCLMKMGFLKELKHWFVLSPIWQDKQIVCLHTVYAEIIFNIVKKDRFCESQSNSHKLVWNLSIHQLQNLPITRSIG